MGESDKAHLDDGGVRRRSVLGFLAMAVPPVAAISQRSHDVLAAEDGPAEFREFDLYKVRIRAMLTEHREQDQANLALAISELQGVNAVVLEYVPSETPPLVAPLYRGVNQRFFQTLDDTAANLRAQGAGPAVWRVDPAHNFQWAALALEIGLPETLASTALMVGGQNYASTGQILLRSEAGGPVSRRALLKSAVMPVTVFGIVAPLTSTLPVEHRLENALRHAVIAGHLAEISKLASESSFRSAAGSAAVGLGRGSEILVVYPREHWEGIEHYLLHPRERVALLNALEPVTSQFDGILTAQRNPNRPIDDGVLSEHQLVNEITDSARPAGHDLLG